MLGECLLKHQPIHRATSLCYSLGESELYPHSVCLSGEHGTGQDQARWVETPSGVEPPQPSQMITDFAQYRLSQPPYPGRPFLRRTI